MIWTVGIILGMLAVVSVTAYVFTHQKSFGRLPVGDRLDRISKSPNFSNGQFRNLVFTPQLAEGVKMTDILTDKLFSKTDRIKPKDLIPSVKTDLKNLDKNEDVLVWLGHSSYFIQINGRRIIIDPVLSGSAAPVSFMLKAFAGADIYKAEDIPEVDYLFITHDHWDHLDYKTVMKLKERIGKVVCGLGVGEHFQRWGFDGERIVELDWDDSVSFSDGFVVHALPTRHFSGRGLKRNASLWVSYLLEVPYMKLYIGGDGGYGGHFARIGERFGRIDLALLENGQYDRKWKYIHCMPEQVVEIADQLHASRFIPGHSSKFALAAHPWDEPLRRVSAAYGQALADPDRNYQPKMLTPMIGESVYIKDTTRNFTEWWTAVE